MNRLNSLVPGAADRDTSPATVAREILKRSSITSAPVSLPKILELWPELRVSLDDLDSAGYFIDLGDIGGEILINRRDPEVRRRFTTAHEIGHWLLGVERSGPLPVISETSESFRWNYKDDTERWCDRLAAELLMPARLVIDFFDSALNPAAMAQRMSGLARQFDVSEASAFNRMTEVFQIRAVLVRSDRRIYFQSYSSKLSGREKMEFHTLARAVLRSNETEVTTVNGDSSWGWAKLPGRNSTAFLWLSDPL